MMPERIQRRRTKGWRMPPNTVYVGWPSSWGNPFVIGRDGTAAQVVHLYAAEYGTGHPSWLEPLRGKHLACWCPLDRPCHADVLLELANAPSSRFEAPDD